jgi:hypothetical protein
MHQPLGLIVPATSEQLPFAVAELPLVKNLHSEHF